MNKVELIDGTIDVAPVGPRLRGSNDFGYAEYVTGKTTKNRVGLDFSYFLSGVEFGGTIDYFWGTYDPIFYTDSSGRRVKLNPGRGRRHDRHAARRHSGRFRSRSVNTA